MYYTINNSILIFKTYSAKNTMEDKMVWDLSRPTSSEAIKILLVEAGLGQNSWRQILWSRADSVSRITALAKNITKKSCLC